MKCPKCKEEISYVRVYSECWQKGYLKEGTNAIKGYDPVQMENVLIDTTGITCPECGEDISDSVEE